MGSCSMTQSEVTRTGIGLFHFVKHHYLQLNTDIRSLNYQIYQASPIHLAGTHY